VLIAHLLPNRTTAVLIRAAVINTFLALPFLPLLGRKPALA
jgi:hypothetical protein